MIRSRTPAFNHPTCTTKGCGAHFYPRRNGACVRAEVVIPVPGRTEGAVYRYLSPDGTRTATVALYVNGCWSYGLPLPRRPRKAWASAVAGAREFLRTGDLR